MMTYSADLAQLMDSINAENVNTTAPGKVVIYGMTEDSRQIEKGDLFIARPGLESDGRRYIHQAVSKGASAVLVEAHEQEQFFQITSTDVPVYVVNNLHTELGKLADYFFNKPSAELTVVGITGTNGKTSCTQISARLLGALGYKVAIMGTMGNGPVDALEDTTNTTIDALSIHRYLAQFRDDDYDYVIMEVSSHALAQGRVNQVRFHAAIFTNLTRDHLDYHGDMGSYAEAKKVLFSWPELKLMVVNSDDSVGVEILEDAGLDAEKYSFSITAINARDAKQSVFTEAVEFGDEGIAADVNSPWGAFELKTSLIGQFNLSNCLAVFTLLGALKLDPEKVLSEIEVLQPVAGRMECFGGQEKPMAVIDYAHTPDALKHALKALRPHTQHDLWCVFGCGGDRDRGKRPQMSAIAEEFADHVVLTSDNPRRENVIDIIDEMRKGLSEPTACTVELDRKQAIQTSIRRAVIGDVVLVAGKGHEQYQQVANERLPHSDLDCVEESLQKGKWL